MAKTLFVFGGNATALEIAETATRYPHADWEEARLVVPDAEDADGNTRIRASQLPDFVRHGDGRPGFIISMWKQEIRQEWLQLAAQHSLQPFSVVHPLAFVSQTAKIGKGVYVAAQAVVSANAFVDDHVVINYNVSVGHDSTIGSHSFLNPGARISGNVSVGQRVLVGANAFIYQGKSVGDDTLIDALAYVDRDVESGMICAGRRCDIYRRVV